MTQITFKNKFKNDFLKINNINNTTKEQNFFGFDVKNNLLTPLKNDIFTRSENEKLDCEKLRKEGITKLATANGQTLGDDTFFIRMRGYGKNKKWAQNMNFLTYHTSMSIKSGMDFKTILDSIEHEIKEMQENHEMQHFFGQRRKGTHVFPLAKGLRGCEYIERYKKKIDDSTCSKDEFETFYFSTPTQEYKNANVCILSKGNSIFNSHEVYIFQDAPYTTPTSNIELAQREFEKLKNTKNPTPQEVNKSCAIIKWLFAQETPYERGSDSISNILIRGIQHAYNIKITPLKKGISLDFEAFDTNLDDYIKNFPSFFEEYPERIRL